METKTTAQTQTPNETQLFSKLRQIRTSLASLVVGRGAEIDGALVGLVTGEPVLMVGPPGTAKTLLVELLSRHIGAKYFYYLLNRFTEPDELLGPIDVVALTKGERRRIVTNRLPDAHIVFLDEIFKASSAIRNILLDIILNKRFYDNGNYVKLPIIAMYFASNEVSYDAEDAAFFDRMTIKLWPQYVSNEFLEELIIKGVSVSVNGAASQIMSLEEIQLLQSIIREMAVRIVKLINFEKMKNVIKDLNIAASDRTLVKSIFIAAGVCIVYGMDCTNKDAVMDALIEALTLVGPRSYEEYKEITSKALQHYSWWEKAKELRGLVSDFRVVVDQLSSLKFSVDASSAEYQTARELLRRAEDIGAQLETLAKTLPKNRHVEESVREAARLIKRYTEIKKKIASIVSEA